MTNPETLKQKLAEFESQFAAKLIPAGTPNRKNLWKEALRNAHIESSKPENIAMRVELMESIASAKRSDAALERAKSQSPIRKLAMKHLRKLGFKRECTSGKSAYYANNQMTVRISDHEVPMSSERMVAEFTWANTWKSFEIFSNTTCFELLRWIVQIRRELA